jgi:hypothetical protein
MRQRLGDQLGSSSRAGPAAAAAHGQQQQQQQLRYYIHTYLLAVHALENQQQYFHDKLCIAQLNIAPTQHYL